MRGFTVLVEFFSINWVGPGFWEYRYNGVVQVPPSRQKAYRWAAVNHLWANFSLG